MSILINKHIQSYRAQVEEIIKDLHELTINIGHDELAKTLSELRNRIHEPFMFVIVGEVKSGKSSFINALLDIGREITEVAPEPKTDTIQQILYGDEEEIIVINQFLKKILLPVDILREIAIVDTPGTNTIIEHHQEITEDFIPASDLIVFVFEAKNPYRQSAWDFFDFIREDWHKKIIFILQQKDLMDESDLRINLEGLKKHALQKGMTDPVVFPVSAKQELENKKEESGFSGVRQYIKQNITGGRAPILKLQNNIETSLNIGERIREGLDTRHAQWEADIAFRQDIRETLDDQEKRSNKQVDLLVENLIAGYDRITSAKEQELRSGLSFFSLLKRSISAIFSKKTSAKEWLDNLASDLEAELKTELNNKLNDGVGDLADSIQQMAKLIDLKIRNSTTILKENHDIFSDIAERRANVMRELQDTFTRFVNRSENFTDQELFPDKETISPNLATGSGIAVVGIIIAAVTQGVVFDITGGVLTTIGLLFAGFSTRAKRKKIITGFNKEIDRGRNQLEEEVTSKLKTYIHNLKTKIDSNFNRFDQLLEKEEKQIAKLNQQHSSITGRLRELQEEIQKQETTM